MFFLLRREFRRFPFTKTEHTMTDVMTETTMQGEKKKIDETQTRDRKNVITILLMLAIPRQVRHPFISTIKRDYYVVDVLPFFCVLYNHTYTHTNRTQTITPRQVRQMFASKIRADAYGDHDFIGHGVRCRLFWFYTITLLVCIRRGSVKRSQIQKLLKTNGYRWLMLAAISDSASG